MSRKRYRLTPVLLQQIVSSIRAGGYAHVAAETGGVPASVLEGWLRRGEAAGAREPYASFAASVRQAQAQARLRAENEVFSEKVQAWLEHGPGRERPGLPGWSTAVKPPSTNGSDESNAWLSPDFRALLRNMLAALEDNPALKSASLA